MGFGLVIFDCDGVLVDSEMLSCRAHAAALTRNGYPITTEQVLARFLGRATRDARAEIEAELGRPLPSTLETELKAELLRLFSEELAPMPFVHEAIGAIASPICVARCR